jgi:hypothetical protein
MRIILSYATKNVPCGIRGELWDGAHTMVAVIEKPIAANSSFKDDLRDLTETLENLWKDYEEWCK